MLSRGLRALCVTCFALLLLLLAGNVFVRYVPLFSFHWFDEVVEGLFAWLVFMGAAELWLRGDHFRLDWIMAKAQARPVAGPAACLLLETICLFFLLIFTYQAAVLTVLARDWTPVFNVSRRYLYVCMPISGLIMTAGSVRNVWRAAVMLRQGLAGTAPAGRRPVRPAAEGTCSSQEGNP